MKDSTGTRIILSADTNRGFCVSNKGSSECWDVCNSNNKATDYNVTTEPSTVNTAFHDAVKQARAGESPGVYCPSGTATESVPCSPGRGCRYNGEAGRGTCVLPEQGEAQCWDTCDTDIDPDDYCGSFSASTCEDRVRDMRNNKISPGCGAGGWWWGWVIGLLVLCCLCCLVAACLAYYDSVRPMAMPDYEDKQVITEEVYEVTEEPDEFQQGAQPAYTTQPMAYYQTRAPVSNSFIPNYSMGAQQPAFYSQGAAPTYVSGPPAQPYSTRFF